MGEFLRKTSILTGTSLAVLAIAVAAQISPERSECGRKPEFSSDFSTAVCSDGKEIRLHLANGISKPFEGKLMGWNDKIGQGYVAIGVRNQGNCLISVVSPNGEVFPVPYLQRVDHVHWIFSRPDGDYLQYSWNMSNILITSELKLAAGAEPLTLFSLVTGQPIDPSC